MKKIAKIKIVKLRLLLAILSISALVAAPPSLAAEVKNKHGNSKKTEHVPIPGSQFFSSHLSHQVFGVLYAEMLLNQGKTKQAADTIYYLASKYVDIGIYRRALAILSTNSGDKRLLEVAKNWVNAEPESLEARQKLIGVLIRQQQIAEIAPDLEFVLKAKPENINANLLSVNHLFASIKDKNLVLAIVTALVDKFPITPEALMAKATAYANVNKFTEAEDLAIQAEKLKPDWEIPVLFRVVTLINNSNKSIEILQEFLQKNPEAKASQHQLVKLLTVAKRYSEAEKSLIETLQNTPDDAESIYSLGLLSIEQKKFSQAEDYFNQLIELENVDQNKVNYILAKIYEEQKKDQLAIESYAKVYEGQFYLSARSSAIKLLVKDKQYDNALNLLNTSKIENDNGKIFFSTIEAQIYREKKQLNKALEVIQLAIKQFPQNTELLYEGAMLADQLNLPDLAESKLRLAIKYEPQNFNYLNALGYIFAERNIRLDEAEQLIVKALSYAPNLPQILDSMGWILYRKGKFTEAISYLEKAYKLLPDPEVAAHIVEVKWVQGSRQEAESFLEAASKISPEHEAFEKVRKIIKIQ